MCRIHEINQNIDGFYQTQDTSGVSHCNLLDHEEFQVFPSANNLKKEIARVHKACESVVGTNKSCNIPCMAFPCHNYVHVYQEHTLLHQIHKANPPVYVYIHVLSKIPCELVEHSLPCLEIMFQSVHQVLEFFPIVDYQLPFEFK